MAFTGWKPFKFFDVSQVKLPDAESASLFEQGNITCVASGSDNVFLGSQDGVVRIVSSAFKVMREFQAHDTGSIRYMKPVQGTSLLVTIAEDLSSEPTLKVWALDKLEKKTGIPRCQSTLTIHNGRKQFPVTAFAAMDDLSQLAVGFGNGAVTVVRGDLIHDRGARQRTVFESEEPITVDKSTGDVIVARDDALYSYGLSGRRAVYTYEGPKEKISTYKDYTAIVSPPKTNTITRAVRTFGRSAADDLFSTSSFTILDTDMKIIAHQEALTSPVQAVFVEWGDLFVLTQDGKLLRYHEKTFQQKLELMYQRDLYIIAINMAQKAGVDKATQNVILRRYGDHLYQKGDYDTAMQQYLKAIDNTEPSQVIRKFLDTQRIHNLIEYLEELHEHQKATPDHTTLLLNCYAKLKDVDKLEAFIRMPGDPKFDLDTAIAMCRQGGYYDQAAFLARKHNEHELVVDILIEDSKRYAEALAYIWRLEPQTAYQNFMKYATVLLEHCPKDTTQIFIDYYTGHFRPKKDAVVIPNAPATSGMGIVNNAATAVQNLAALLPLPYMNVNTINSPNSGDQKTTASQAQIVETTIDEPPPEYKVPKPRTAFSSFVDHPNEFIIFLEACKSSQDINEEDKVDLYTTLFEMYLHVAASTRDGDKEEWENKAKKLVEGKDIPIDDSNVLLLSELTNFKDGTILVREQQGLRADIFRAYTSAKDTPGAIKALRKYGPEDAALYPAALAYFTSSPAILEEAGDELDAVLRKIDEDGLMAPLQVIQTLSANGIATMGMIKKYLATTIDRERREIANNRKMIQTFTADTATKKAELDTLKSKPIAFTASRCSSCPYPLDQPTVHFMCNHSFHQRCLDVDSERDVEDPMSGVECPICAPQNATIKAIKKAQEDSAERHDIFLDALGKSRDKFANSKTTSTASGKVME
ncbi:Zinc finger RING-type protein [Neofusicoccum parvum]|uniref:Zinc finger RING-type protein n=1 Tax=Neofusicoccum parvum TaxID=310453 RepID=A0ACB5RXM9_9PEZI|nr:Zinc finger RING-type protein [Neofusicoccum parvum]GME51392.1 Zinc finger RING-type protein [Neofusicoccum parvum]